MKALEWRDVDGAGGVVRLRPEISKNKEGRVLPLHDEVSDLIDRARAKRRADCPFVFHLKGRRIGDFRKMWKAACKAADLGGLIVHDLRRTAVRNYIRAGVSERIAMSLSGHKTRSVFDRYNIVSEADLLRASEKLQSHLKMQQTVTLRISIDEVKRKKA
jgi:integrase